ncbi:MarR family transcriptional regulator [Pseudonocardia sp. UM4_GMWB1]|jgi:DNA-binding MarR family transcriptional regulator|uniref:MarR family winged helix-turn-helix transcriptional regulator n=1 Tax=Pseudonocardia sp. UM4_GMWB1 TaxID=2212989 RepID=UPI00307D0BD5
MASATNPSAPYDKIDAIAAAWLRERPGTPVGGMQVVTRVWQLAKLFGDARRRVVTEEGADLATLDLLSTLRRAGQPYELSTRELAQQSMVTAGAISQRLARAERDGLIRRTRASGARTVVVTLLDDGHRLVERLVGRVAETDESLLAGLSEDQRRSLDALLTQALDDLYRRFGSQSVTHVGLE